MMMMMSTLFSWGLVCHRTRQPSPPNAFVILDCIRKPNMIASCIVKKNKKTSQFLEGESHKNDGSAVMINYYVCLAD